MAEQGEPPMDDADLSSSTDEEEEEDEEERELLASQARFFQREGKRRWANYFRKAHEILNDLRGDRADDGESEDGDERLNGKEVDAVRFYHFLYEAVNQVVGGVQLAFEAGVSSPGGPDSDGDSDGMRLAGSGQDVGPVAAMSVAFMSAAVVLARLATASTGTPLELEDFGAQAGATLALACQPYAQEGELSKEEVLRCLKRIRWEGFDASPPGSRRSRESWRSLLVEDLLRRAAGAEAAELAGVSQRSAAVFQRSWQMYAEDLAQAVWRSAEPPPPGQAGWHMGRSTLNPLDVRLVRASGGEGHIWQLFSTYVMSKPLHRALERAGPAAAEEDGDASSAGGGSSSSSSAGGDSSGSRPGGEAACPACAELTRIVMAKYLEFDRVLQNESSHGTHEASSSGRSRRMRADEVNNAFFAWQLTHEVEQAARGATLWPELYKESQAFRELKKVLKLTCLEYLQQVYDAAITEAELAQLELSIWASVTPPLRDAGIGPAQEGSGMGLEFHDHPLALLSGVFYAQAGGRTLAERTPTIFADPRGTPAFRYTSRRSQRHDAEEAEAGQSKRPGETLEPSAPFHRLAYAHATDGLAVVFPSWLVHGVPMHSGQKTRVAFAFNLHTLQGTTLSSWVKTAL